MLHEYGIDPEVIAQWAKPQYKKKHLINSFGIGTPRLVSRYPQNWARRAWRASGTSADASGRDHTRTVELIKALTEKMIRRDQSEWDDNQSWLDNAIKQHASVPFRAILTTSVASTFPREVVPLTEIDDSVLLWDIQNSITVARIAESLAAAVSSMLKLAEEIVFVDPHFNPAREHYRNAFGAYLRECFRDRTSTPAISILGKLKPDGAEKRHFKEICSVNLSRMVPAGAAIKICRLEERKQGQKLHNRFILTDIGGVGFATGLDEASPDQQGSEDDLFILGADAYRERWRQYVDPAIAFDRPEGWFAIKGGRKGIRLKVGFDAERQIGTHTRP